MKIKRFFIGLSMISFLAFCCVSCSEEGSMGIGDSAGGDPPRGPEKTAISSLPAAVDAVDVTDLSED